MPVKMRASPVNPSIGATTAWSRRAARLAAVLLIGALAGCSLAPPIETPALPVPDSYPAAPTPADRADPPAALLPWQDYFLDPALQGIIRQALENSRDLRTAMLRVQEARALYGIQRADQLPTIAAMADGSRARMPGDLNFLGQSMVSSQYQVGVGLATWELDFWGRVRNLKEAALENYLATDEARRAVTLSLIAQVANSYLGLRELDRRIALAQETIVSRQESLRIFTRRFEVGSIAKMDLVQVEVLLQQAQTLAVQLQQARDTQLHALALLIGAPPQLPSAPANDDFSDEAVARTLQVGLPSDLLLQRPDILAAEHQLRAARANIGAARAAFFPSITLTGSLGTASAELSGLFDPGSRAWTFLPSLTVPLFDAGRARAGVDLAEVRRDMVVANYEKTIQAAFRDVADALSAGRWLSEQVRIAQATLRAQAERTRLAKLQYDNGSAPYFEFLDAQRDLLSAEQQLVQTRRALLSSRVSLYAALGGGSASIAPADVAGSTPH